MQTNVFELAEIGALTSRTMFARNNPNSRVYASAVPSCYRGALHLAAAAPRPLSKAFNHPAEFQKCWQALIASKKLSFQAARDFA